MPLLEERPFRPVRYGMVGGGPGSFVGPIHRMAAALDGELELVAGAFSSDADRSAACGLELGLARERAYGTWREMLEAEAARPADERMEVVSVVTPNGLHFPVARACLEAGFHVICDKPLTNTVEEAEALCRLVAERDLVFSLTHNYTGYPMVKEARERVRGGALGAIRKVVVEYSQGWLATLLEATGHKQAGWRGDPAMAGVSSALADIGTHAHNLVRYVTGLEVEELLADLGTVVEGRLLEDDATVLLRLSGGVRALLFASQISVGQRNHLRLRVYGAEGGLDWLQEAPGELTLREADGTETVLHAGSPALSPRARAHTRLPPGHPEGFVEAFANLYRNVARTLRARGPGLAGGPFDADFPTVQDGARGVAFLHRAVESGRRRAWVAGGYEPPA